MKFTSLTQPFFRKFFPEPFVDHQKTILAAGYTALLFSVLGACLVTASNPITETIGYLSVFVTIASILVIMSAETCTEVRQRVRKLCQKLTYFASNYSMLQVAKARQHSKLARIDLFLRKSTGYSFHNPKLGDMHLADYTAYLNQRQVCQRSREQLLDAARDLKTTMDNESGRIYAAANEIGRLRRSVYVCGTDLDARALDTLKLQCPSVYGIVKDTSRDERLRQLV